MSESLPPTDPFAVQRELVSQWEKSVNALLTQHMSTSDFAKQMHEAIAASQTPKALGKLSGPASLATKEDVAKMGERLQAVEEQLGRVINMLEQMVPADDSAARHQVARTKRFAEPQSATP